MTGCILALLLSAFASLNLAADDSLQQRAEDLVTQGKYAEAESLARQLLTQAEAAAPDSEAVAAALELSAKCAYVLGKAHTQEAHDAALRSVAIREKIFGPGHLTVARSLHWLVAILLKNGEDEAARPYAEREVAIYERAGLRTESLAGSLGSLGNLDINLGDAPSAIKVFDRAIAILTEISKTETRTFANILTNQAIAYRVTGNYAASTNANLRGLAIYEHLLGPDHLLLTFPLKTLGTLYVAMDEPAHAIPYLERALSIIARSKTPSYFLTGALLESLGQAKAKTGDTAGGLALLERAIATQRSMYGDFHPHLMLGLPNLAALLAYTGRIGPAFDAALESAAIGSRYADNAIPTLSEREAVLNAADCSLGMHTVLSLLAAYPSLPPGRAYDSVIRTRARVFDEMARRRRVPGYSGGSEADALIRQLTAAREALARAAVQRTDPAELQALSENKERAERALAAQSVRFRDELAGRRGGLEEVAAALTADAVLISYVRFNRSCVDPKSACRLFASRDPQAYLAFVLSGGSRRPAAFPLGPAPAIDRAVAAVRKQIAAEGSAPGLSPKRSEAAYRVAAAHLRTLVWDPLLPAIGNARSVFLVPDGTLHLINFAALPAGESHYLVEQGPLLMTLSAERDLLRGSADHNGEGLLALAPAATGRPPAPAASARRGSGVTGCVSPAAMRFPPLPGTARELDAITAIWKQSGASALALKGDDASKAAFKQRAAGRRVLHLATHGFFLSGCSGGENPLLWSGLTLGATSGQHDGILTAEEIATLDLDGVEWAVLSACETGAGEIRDGEGVFGLRRAFQVAGTRTVIMSLWPVDDEASRVWITSLYRRRFLLGQSTGEAVRHASREVLSLRRTRGESTHPWYWASFVAAGDWH